VLYIGTRSLRCQTTLCAHNAHNILIRNRMAKPNSLRQMLRRRAPNQSILETVLQRPVNRVAYVLDITALAHDQSFVKRGLNTLTLRIDAHELQFFPASLDHFCDSEVKFAGHDGCVVFAGESVEVLQADAVDFVVDVETLDVRSVLFHDDVDELVDSRCDDVSDFYSLQVVTKVLATRLYQADA
jgi:hypothetical protein